MDTPPPLPPSSTASQPPHQPYAPAQQYAQAQLTSEDKLWSILSHLSGFVGVPLLLPLIVYLVKRDESGYVRANAAEALNFHISVFIYSICCIPLVFIIIGIPLLLVIGIGSLILSIIAAVKASDGQCYRYPFTIHFVK